MAVELLTGFLTGLLVAFSATWFPGMLNMQSVATSLRAGRSAGYRFSAGLSAVIALQAGVAIFFADFLTSHPGIIDNLKRWAIPLFLTLAAFFIAKGFRSMAARKAEIEPPYQGGPFWRGAGMAAMNLLNIPLFFALGGWLLAGGFLVGDFGPKTAYTTGTGLGSFGIFCLYARMAEWISRHAALFTRNINFFIGALFILLAIIQGWRLAY